MDTFTSGESDQEFLQFSPSGELYVGGFFNGPSLAVETARRIAERRVHHRPRTLFQLKHARDVRHPYVADLAHQRQHLV
jgi:hypothetical protein